MLVAVGRSPLKVGRRGFLPSARPAEVRTGPFGNLRDGDTNYGDTHYG